MSENEVTSIFENGKSKNFPFDIKPVDPAIREQLLSDFTGETVGFVQVGPKKYFFPSVFSEHAEHLYNFEARPDDVWIATFPRSGTTMTQELVWLIANDFDYHRAQLITLAKRFPFFDHSILMNVNLKSQLLHEQRSNPANQNTIKASYGTPEYEVLVNYDSPRFVKTHLPFSLMPPSVMKAKAKVIYVARHPKDVAVSWYHLNRMFRNHGYVNDFSQFWDYFEKDLTMWSPYWEHVKEGWEHREDPNVLFLFYEDLIRDLPGNILKVASFLNKEVDDDNLKRLVEHLNIKNFRNNQSVNSRANIECGLAISKELSFVRNGKVSMNGWQTEYTPELIARAETWIEENLRDTTLKFPEY